MELAELFGRAEPGGRDMEYSPSFLVVDLTRKCTAECAHCIVDASPRRKETLDIENVRSAVGDAANNNILSVCFYGGEPFTDRKLLYESVEEVYRNGLIPQIMTNGFWGKTPESVKRVFDEIKQLQDEVDTPASLIIVLSTDKWHQERIPLESLANIIIEWRRRDDVNVSIELGTHSSREGESGEILWALLDKIDEISGLQSTNPKDDFFGKRTVGFVDKKIEVSQNRSKAEALEDLKREAMLGEREIEILEEVDGDSDMDVYALIAANNWMCLVCNEENQRKGTYAVGRLSEKRLGYGSNVISLFGRASSFLEDEDERRIQSEMRMAVDKTKSVAEKQQTLILGVDNRFYVQPSQMTEGLGNLGENDGYQISRAIASVNNGDVVSRVLITEDVDRVSRAVQQTGDNEAQSQFDGLIADGFDYEAIVGALKNERVIVELKNGVN